MARMNISVPEEMRAEITRLGEKVNWSGLAQDAFAREIARLSKPKETTMSSVIERLRESKKKHEEEVVNFGKLKGRQWAEQRAEWPELQRVAKIEGPEHVDDWALEALFSAIDPDLSPPDVARHLGIEAYAITDEFAEAFIDGAREVYEEVEDKI